MADERLGASFSIDITQLQAGLKTANKLIRESQSEFKAAAAGMDNWQKSEAGLTARNQALTKQIAVQREKVDALKKNYQNLINQGLDPASDRAIQLRTQINKEEAALRSNEKELKDNTKALDNLGDEALEAGKDAKKSTEGFTVLKGVLANLATDAVHAVVDGMKKMGAAIVKVGKQAIESYAEYEQLVGGVETLFGAGGMSIEEYAKSVGKSVKDVEGEYNNLMTAQNAMITNANNAYKTAGMSANEYMSNVTGFSASLISSLEGDTVAAAAAADQAMTDISDNANKMGTDMQTIVDTYQSLARGNYQMLDNLKLGYGGTKEEMQRMIADANAVKVANGEMADLSIDSFADITEAIHIIQGEMGITGTTAKEASTTIQGSIGMMKSSWQNLLTGMADDTMDFDQLISNFIDSIEAVASNLMPRIKVVINGILKLVEGLLPQIPPIIEDFLPDLVKGVVDLIKGLVKQLPAILDTILDVIPTFLDELIKTMPEILKALTSMVSSTIEGLSKMLPDIVDAIVEVVPLLIDALLDSMPELLDASIELLMAIVQAVPTIVQGLIDALPDIINTILTFLTDSLPEILDGAIDMLMAIVEALPTVINSLVDALPQIISSIVTFLIQNIPTIIDAAIKLFNGLIQAIPEILPAVVSAIPQIVSAIFNELTSPAMIDTIKQAGSNLIQGLWNGISDMATWIGEKIQGFGQGVLDKLKKFFGIASPSKVMRDQVGKNIARGVIEGVDGQKKNAGKSASELAKIYVDSAKNKVDALKKHNKITIADEIALWQEVLKHTKKGTKEYKEAHEELYQAQKDYRQKSLQYDKEYANGVSSVQKKLKDDIKSVLSAYDEAVASRKSSLLGQFNLFEAASVNLYEDFEAVQSKDLIKNLSSQVDALEQYDEILDSISKRKGVSSGFMEEMQSMGVGNLRELQAVESMSEEEFQKYIGLWKKRNKLANERATQENEDLLKSTKKQIKTLTKKAGEDVQKLKNKYVKNLASLGVSIEKQSEKNGVNIVAGLENGIKSKNKEFQEYLKKFFGSITDQAQKSLKIHSPSLVMKNLIGKNIALGIVEGFDENIKGLRASINGVNDDLTKSVDFGNKSGISGKSVVINQTNHYAQAHSRYEIYKSKQQTAAAVRLALGTV